MRPSLLFQIAVGCVLLSLVFLSAAAYGQDTVVTGAGATFPYPVYSKWAYAYEKATGVKLNYQAIGSGGGIAQIKAKTVDFGASDAPLDEKDLKDAGLLQFPMIVGGVVPVLNVPGIAPGQLKLTPKVLADIFLERIQLWNDPAIKALNPGVDLPNEGIVVVHRADKSGTTWIFTHYLARVSADWANKVGADKAVPWPTGVGGEGNAGVANFVKQLPGALGYVEYAYAAENKLTYAQLQNKAGKFVSPTIESFQAAAANADWENTPGFAVVLVDQPGDDTWPITGASFILVYPQQRSAAQAKTMLKFFDWSFKHGQKIASDLDYVPLPDNVVNLVETTWQKEIRAGGARVWP